MQTSPTIPLQMPANGIPEPPPFPELKDTDVASLVDSSSSEGYLQYGLYELWQDRWVWIIILIALIIIGLQAYLYIRRKKLARAAIITPAQVAVREINELRASHPTLKHAAVGFSLILRKYLVGETDDPALYETQQEFNRRAGALTALPEHLQAPARDLLDRMAALKYEPNTPDDDAVVGQLAVGTLQLIDDIEATHRAPAEETDLLITAKKSSK